MQDLINRVNQLEKRKVNNNLGRTFLSGGFLITVLYWIYDMERLKKEKKEKYKSK